MGWSGTQTDTSAQDGPMKACAVGTLAAIPRARQMASGATPGVTEETISIAADSERLGWMLQSAPGEPGGITWPTGTVVSRLNITSAPGTLYLHAIYVCRITSAGVLVGSYGSLTGMHVTLSPGVKTHNVPVSRITGSVTDELYMVYSFHNHELLINQSVGITPDQVIDTPIVPPVPGDGREAVLAPTHVVRAYPSTTFIEALQAKEPPS